MTCTFFGHRKCEHDIKDILHKTLVDLIENKNVDNFYVGNQGQFDRMVLVELRKLKVKYPHINFAVVLAYMPPKNKEILCSTEETILPEGIEFVFSKYAIDYRNKWMIEKTDYVVSYVINSFGGAHKFSELAKRKNKTVINVVQGIM